LQYDENLSAQFVEISEFPALSATEEFLSFFVITGVNAAVMQEITIKLIRSSIKEKPLKNCFIFF